MFRGSSVIPPEVFVAHAKKHHAARLEAIRTRLQLQMRAETQAFRNGVAATPARPPLPTRATDRRR